MRQKLSQLLLFLLRKACLRYLWTFIDPGHGESVTFEHNVIRNSETKVTMDKARESLGNMRGSHLRLIVA